MEKYFKFIFQLKLLFCFFLNPSYVQKNNMWFEPGDKLSISILVTVGYCFVFICSTQVMIFQVTPSYIMIQNIHHETVWKNI